MFQLYQIEASGLKQRALYLFCTLLAVYYWLDSVVFDVHNPLFPELRPDRTSYRWAIAARTIQFVAMSVCGMIYVQRYTLPHGLMKLVEFSMWCMASVG